MTRLLISLLALKSRPRLRNQTITSRRRSPRSDLGRTVRGLLRFAPADISIHLDGRPTEAHGSGTEPSLMDFFLRDGLRTWALLASSPLVCRRTVWRNQAIGLLGRLVRSPPIGSQLVKRRGPAACRSFAAVAFRRLRYTRSRGSASPDAAELLRDSRVAFACGSRHSRRGGSRKSAINFVLRRLHEADGLSEQQETRSGLFPLLLLMALLFGPSLPGNGIFRPETNGPKRRRSSRRGDRETKPTRRTPPIRG